MPWSFLNVGSCSCAWEDLSYRDGLPGISQHPWDPGRDAGKLPPGPGLGCSVSRDSDHSFRHLFLGTEQRATAVTVSRPESGVPL